MYPYNEKYNKIQTMNIKFFLKLLRRKKKRRYKIRNKNFEMLRTKNFNKTGRVTITLVLPC